MPGLVRLADARLATLGAAGRRAGGWRRRRGVPGRAATAVRLRARGRILGGDPRRRHLPAEGQPGPEVPGAPAGGARARDPRARSDGRAGGRRRQARRSIPATPASCWTTRRGAATSGASRTWRRPSPRPSRSATPRARRGPRRRSRCWAPSSAGRSGWGAGRAGRAGRRNGRAAPSSAGSRTPSNASANTTTPWAPSSPAP